MDVVDDIAKQIRLNPNQELGRLIKEMRIEREIVQLDLATRINLLLRSSGAIGFPLCRGCQMSRLEAGARDVSALELLAIAEILRVHPYHFAPWRKPGFPKSFVDGVAVNVYQSPFSHNQRQQCSSELRQASN